MGISITTTAILDSLEPRRLFAAGDPIESFGDAGTAVLDRAYGNVVPSQLLPLRSGKLLMAVNSQYDPRNRYGQNPTSRPPLPVDLIRLNADGTPDRTFGPEGRGVDARFNSEAGFGVDTPYVHGVLAIHERPDGTLDVVGTVGQELYRARFTADGALDTTLGDGGYVKLDIEAAGTEGRLPFIRIYDDGTVLAASNYNYIYRFNPDGSLDPSFGINGRVISKFGRHIAFADDKSVYISGTRRAFSGREVPVIRKLTPGGEIDTGFAVGGEIHLGRSLFPVHVARVSDGWVALIWASPNQYAYSTGALQLMKFDDSGTLDGVFGDGGIIQHTAYDWDPPTQVMVDEQDRIVTLSAYEGQGRRGSGRMVRYQADGSVDASFGELLWPTGSTVLLASASSAASFAIATESRVLSLASDGNAPGPVNLSRNGTLTLSGTTRSEELAMFERYVPARSLSELRWFAQRDTWARAIDVTQVARIVIDAGAGDDVLTAPLIDRRVTLIGARGNDRLVAGHRSSYQPVLSTANVVISGGDGDDEITFFGTAITVEGGRGNDLIRGNFAGRGTAINLIRGGLGDDFIHTTGPRGQRGFDIFGDGGADTILSGGSHDLLDGGPDRDTLGGDTRGDTLVNT